MAKAMDELTAWLVSMGIGVPPETPSRIIRMYDEFFYTGAQLDKPPFDFTVFDNKEQFGDLVVVGPIHFYSMCEHHLVPFFGNAFVGYLPHERIVGLSKIPRTVDWYARRPQLQERLTGQIADFIHDHLRPKGTIVLTTAEHMCMTMRGCKARGCKTDVSACRGVFIAQPDARQEFFNVVHARRSDGSV